MKTHSLDSLKSAELLALSIALEQGRQHGHRMTTACNALVEPKRMEGVRAWQNIIYNTQQLANRVDSLYNQSLRESAKSA